ncbi:MAG: DUF1631 family protein [Hahellaceae bacterium]|nr:DUF1631 family protein [Hahellaceae bacterium]
MSNVFVNSGQFREKRASERHPIQLGCELIYGDGEAIKARIEDFCAEGVYATFEPDIVHDLIERGMERDSHMLIRFAVGKPPQLFELALLVKRIVDGGLGAMFVGQNSNAISALLQHCSAPLTTGRTPPSETASLVLRQCEKIIMSTLTPLVEAYVRALPETFNQAIATAATDNQKTQLVDSLLLLQKQLQIFQARFLRDISDELLSRSVAVAPAPGRVPQDVGNFDLSLVGKDEFEDWLALKVMITKSETAYRNQLLQIKMRLDAIGLKVGKGYANPLGPPLICNAFRDALAHLRLADAAERLCLKTFETLVLGELEGMYNELNEVLIRAGILPNLNVSRYFSKPATPTTPSSTKAAPAVTPAPAAAPAVKKADEKEDLFSKAFAKARGQAGAQAERSPSTQSTQGLSSSLFQADSVVRKDLQTAEASFRAAQQLFRLLEEERTLPQAAHHSRFPNEREAPAYTNREVLARLGETQAVPVVTDSEAAIDKTPLRDRMYEVVVRQQEKLKALSSHQDKALDVVDRFFASVLKNQKLTAVAKSQVKSLELPVLKLYLRNPDFFQEPDSIPKRVINRIAQLGLKGARTPRAMIERVNHWITRIQAEHENDPSVFEGALGELDSLLERQNLLYRRNVERVTAAAEGQQKISDSKVAVNAALNKRLAGRRVPKAVMTLVNGGWKDLLSLTYIRQGSEGQEWQDYLSVLDTLLNFGNNPEFQFNLPELLRIIQDGLASISSNQMPSGHIRDELKRFLLSEPSVEREWIDVPVVEEERQDADIRQVQEARQRGLQRWLARVQRLQPGDWIRLEQEGGQPDFLRLAWIGSQGNRYVFVNHQGMKVIDLDAPTLAAYLQKGIAVLERDCDRSLVDESLDEMVKDLYEQLNFVSSHDELTGLLQRKEFERQLSLYFGVPEGKSPCGLVLVSLNQFRLINDTVGLDGGDKALRDIARILRSLATSDQSLARFGGDEFILQVPTPAREVAEKILDALGGYRLHWNNKSYSVTPSIGYVDAPAGMVDVGELLHAVENACREAKQALDSSIRGYEADDRVKARRDAIATQVAQLDFKLADEKILLRCQKIIPLHSKTRMGTQYEILLSVYDTSGNLIPAGEFVRAAENYKRMQVVDRWVVGHTLDWMKNNRRQIEAMGGISINLSGHSLNDEKLLEFIFERLTQYDVPLDKICFEITEAAVIANTQDVSEFIQELQEYGCRFCLGNFGSGVSYQLLKILPVDLIKVDGSYIREVANDSNDRMMVRSMTEMAHYLGREIIGPHVESKATVETLKELGVDYVQGYFIERPKSLANF